MASRISTGPMWQVLAVLVVLVASARAQQPARSGEELYVDRLGCWNCHGKTGAGAAGPSISNSQLPLRTFVTAVRLPRGTMPRVVPALASDADLAAVYRWLDGKEAIASPPAFLVGLRPSTETASDGQARAETEVELTVKLADPTLAGGILQLPLRYRVTLAQATAPVGGATIQYRRASSADWSGFTTDERGEVTLDFDRGLVAAASSDESVPASRLRLALTPGRYALVVEALEGSRSADPEVLGFGTAILNVP